MEKNIIMFLVLGLFLFSNINCATPKVPMSSGKAWISKETASPAVNIDGSWFSKDWGKMTFIQCKGCREISGRTEEGWQIDGVVSDKRVFLLFSDKGMISYSAILTAESVNKLSGGYVDGALVTEASITKPMQLTRQEQ